MTSGVLSPWHIAILVVVLLLIFGPKRLPEMGRSLGKGMREFKDSLSAVERTPQEEPGVPIAPSEPIGAVRPREHDAV